MLVSFRGVLIAPHVIVFAVLFGCGAMGLRGTLMVLCRQGMRHLHFASFRWPVRADNDLIGADHVANKCESCSHQVKRSRQDTLTVGSPDRRFIAAVRRWCWTPLHRRRSVQRLSSRDDVMKYTVDCWRKRVCVAFR
jgi:hypothetical protein